ncbi:hypothetical protein JW777_06320 [bacterium]|nr:hypothetical protein [bacterium]
MPKPVSAWWFLLGPCLLAGCSGDLGCSRRFDGNAASPIATDRPSTEGPDAGPRVVCPFCGLAFGRDRARATLEHGGRTYYFCLEDHQLACRNDLAACFPDAGDSGGP